VAVGALVAAEAFTAAVEAVATTAAAARSADIMAAQPARTMVFREVAPGKAQYPMVPGASDARAKSHLAEELRQVLKERRPIAAPTPRPGGIPSDLPEHVLLRVGLAKDPAPLELVAPVAALPRVMELPLTKRVLPMVNGTLSAAPTAPPERQPPTDG